MSIKLSEKLKELRKTKGITQEELGEKFNMTKTGISYWESGKSEPRPSVLKQLAEFYEISSDELLGLSVPDNKLAVLGVVPCGVPIEAVEDVIEYIDVERGQEHDHFGLIARGDSMYPYILNGDTLIVKKTSSVDSGSIAIVKVNGDEATCKKIMINDSGITLIPYNAAYQPQMYTNDDIENLPISIVGKVVQIRRKLK